MVQANYIIAIMLRFRLKQKITSAGEGGRGERASWTKRVKYSLVRLDILNLPY